MFQAEVVVEYNPDDGIVRCLLKGVLNMDTLDYYEREVLKAVAAARLKSPNTRMMFDASNGVVQPPEILERLHAFGPKIRRPGDRLAVIVGSMLAKMQAERVFEENPDERIFRSVDDAEAWLRS